MRSEGWLLLCIRVFVYASRCLSVVPQFGSECCVQKILVSKVRLVG